MNAREFVLQQAEVLRSKGRDVEVTEDERHVRIWSSGPGIWDAAIRLSAYKSEISGRWNLLPCRIYQFGVGDIKRTTYSRIRSAIDVYGDSYKPGPATA